jgi:DNA-binding HxlR family transcriptional regulator
MMQRTSFKEEDCPIARGLEHVGEWWTMLILRDSFQGKTRFDEFQRRLNIAPNMLTRRLRALVASGLLEQRTVEPRGRRQAYFLTDRGRDFWPVLVALQHWAGRHFMDGGKPMVVVDRAGGLTVEPLLAERGTGRPISVDTHRFAAGPGASKRLDAYLEG